jgi:hypothetical protein
MASEVDICNLALAHLGDGATVATIDPPEGSSQAEHCARFYPIARDSLLEMHQWGFVTRRAALALLDNTTDTWAYCYAVPNDVVNVISVLAPEAGDDYSTAPGMSWTQTNPAFPLAVFGAYTPQPFVLESRDDGAEVIYTNQADAVLRYTVRITDTSKFSPLFVECLSWLLASHLAGPVLKGDTGTAAATKAYSVFKSRLQDATESDANQRNVKPAHNVAWLNGR